MGKTPHHMSGKYDTREWPDDYQVCWRWRSPIPVREHTVEDLRYSDRELRVSERLGRRPQPRKIRRTARWWTYTGAWTPSSSRTYWAGRNEKANRRFVKAALDGGRRTRGVLEQRLYESAEKKPRRILRDIW